jgi:DNA (cytosine-5)-methyltransferase 1
MISNQFILPIAHELIVDLFAGGGGASTGIEQAIGRHVDIAVNHDPEAVSLHTANHPQTRHFCSDVFEVDPLAVTDGQPVGLLWASPDCKHFSKAKGGKPVSKKIRSLAGVVIKWVKALKPTNRHPRVIYLENVEEFQDWGPLVWRTVEKTDSDGNVISLRGQWPCPERKGQTFQRWKASLENLGYTIEHRELRGSDFDAPTIRKRLFLVARRDGLPIVWPAPTHAKPDASGKVPKWMKPWLTAADCIDWSIPCPSIFERKKPLADATCRRIAKGIMRYVVEAKQPFLVQYHSAKRPGDDRTASIHAPLPTQTTENRFAVVSAFLAKHYTGAVGSDLADPIGTVTSIDHHSFVAAHLVHMGHGEGKDGKGRFSHGIRDVTDPLNTVTAQGAAAGIVTSHLVKLRGDNVGSPTDEPLHTISAQGLHHGEVRAFLVKYYSQGGTDQPMTDPMHTIPTKDRLGLVMVRGEPWAIVDIGLRMLTPRELYRAQGFPDSYQIERGAAGEPITKTAQVRMCSNSVCPPLARAVVAANYQERDSLQIAA